MNRKTESGDGFRVNGQSLAHVAQPIPEGAYTQRVLDGAFDSLKDFDWGLQLADYFKKDQPWQNAMSRGKMSTIRLEDMLKPDKILH